MKAVIQKVSSASVSVSGKVFSQIEHGLCVLVGIHDEDTSKDVDYIAKKIKEIKLFCNSKNWDSSVIDLNQEILIISQFTLCARLKGNKPDFRKAMKNTTAFEMYIQLVEAIKDSYHPDKITIAGSFGNKMSVNIVNDGPVTIYLDSHKTDRN